MKWAMDLETEISNATGFDSGDKFTSKEQVRAYFTTDNLTGMFAEDPPAQDTLDSWAESVIENCWHCDWNRIILCSNDEFISQLFEPDSPPLADSSLLYEAADDFHDHITKALSDAGVDWEWAEGQCQGYHGWNGSRHPVRGIWGTWKAWTYVSDDVEALVDAAAIEARKVAQALLTEAYRREGEEDCETGCPPWKVCTCKERRN